MDCFGAIEAGGTKFVCGIGSAAHGSIQTITIPTTDPVSTLASVEAFFTGFADRFPVKSIGIGAFGPVALDPRTEAFGTILRTPKPGWSGVNLVERIRSFFAGPIAIDTDVNAAALAEARLLGTSDAQLAYVTVGTGIGGGVVVGGKTVQGAGHPEIGHIRVLRHPLHQGFAGTCPYHGDCLEGLASGPAIKAAWGASLSGLPVDHPAWEIEASYIAQLCAQLLLSFAPHRIVLGGGVMKQDRLFPLIRQHTHRLLAGYLDHYAAPAALDSVIIAPASTEPPGLVGSYLIAEAA